MTDSLRRPGVTSAAAGAARILAASVDLEPFRLAGGTALAWHLGHRLSEDVDFFSFDSRAIHASGVARSIEAIADPGSIHEDERTLHARIAGCSVSFFEIDGRWIDPPVRVVEGLSLATVLEVAAMKLVAVMTRCAKKDFYDLVAIDDHGITISRMVDAAQRMYAGFDAALPHLRRSLAYFDEAETDPDPVSTRGITWPEVKRRVTMIARDLG